MAKVYQAILTIRDEDEERYIRLAPDMFLIGSDPKMMLRQVVETLFALGDLKLEEIGDLDGQKTTADKIPATNML